MAIFQRGPPPPHGRYNWLSINEVLDLRTTNATRHRTVYRTYSDGSVKLYSSQPAAWMTTMKRKKQNRIYLYAVVNLQRNLSSTYCTIEAADRHEASHGLSATAGLLVCFMSVLVCCLNLLLVSVMFSDHCDFCNVSVPVFFLKLFFFCV